MSSAYTPRRLTDYQRGIMMNRNEMNRQRRDYAASRVSLITNYIDNGQATEPGQIQQTILNHMLYVFSCQEEDEQLSKTTRHKNARGFTAVDAEICSSICTQLLRKGSISEKQLNLLYQKAPKYHKQVPSEDWDVEEFKTEWLEQHPSSYTPPPPALEEYAFLEE
jgi:hypothetical protein